MNTTPDAVERPLQALLAMLQDEQHKRCAQIAAAAAAATSKSSM